MTGMPNAMRRVFPRAITRAVIIVAAISGLWVGAVTLESADARAASQPQTRWYKGNTHTHTINSDGDTPPDEVARWYRTHGYHFVVLSDHNFLTSVDGINAVMGADERFLVIPGEEVTDRFETKPIHVNALMVEKLVTPQGGLSVVETVQRNVDAIRAANGVPHINHPNFGWSISADELAQVRHNTLFEIFNGHPMVNNAGGGGVAGLEQVWDALLTRGLQLYGIAVDDAHHFQRPWDAGASRPGQGWIYVRADRLDGRAILDAMERGDFYASTGVELADYQASPGAIRIAVRERAFEKYRVQFIGQGGRLLKEAAATPAVYEIRGDEGYVRAKVYDSNGRVAWTQPVRVRP
ncbi:MAG TPA: CehA/McbA family metallohydrolase [Gemmatimonadaceae bacterium]|nr:CehA/McbA family metallohydrolase [Gemmatimonadaceae bacterium]